MIRFAIMGAINMLFALIMLLNVTLNLMQGEVVMAAVSTLFVGLGVSMSIITFIMFAKTLPAKESEVMPHTPEPPGQHNTGASDLGGGDRPAASHSKLGPGNSG